MSREYPSHPITAVSGAVFNHEGRILLARRANPPARGKWSFPGGVVRLGESQEEALKREIREECGLEVEVGPVVSVTSKIVPNDKGEIQYHYVLLDFLCRATKDVITVGSDALEARWVSVQEIQDYELTEGLEEVIGKAVGMREVT